MAKKYDFSFGAIAEKMGLVQPHFVDVCLLIQSQDKRAGHMIRPLGEIMIERGFLTPTQVDMILSQQKKSARPSGRPISKGWISSYFGKRTDPFSGKIERHKGMDFAGKAGSKISSVSAGVVTWASSRYGYGNLVEINHGHGYSTRYGHNAEILVEVGDTVEKGQAISLMGSTGRSTGPHVHFEVLLNDRQVDPIRFVQSQG